MPLPAPPEQPQLRPADLWALRPARRPGLRAVAAQSGRPAGGAAPPASQSLSRARRCRPHRLRLPTSWPRTRPGRLDRLGPKRRCKSSHWWPAWPTPRRWPVKSVAAPCHRAGGQHPRAPSFAIECRPAAAGYRGRRRIRSCAVRGPARRPSGAANVNPPPQPPAPANPVTQVSAAPPGWSGHTAASRRRMAET